MFDMLLEIPPLIKMKILAGPHMVRDYDKGHEGVTGFVIIDFSHISVHTFVATREIFIDVFSCKKFDFAKVKAYLFRKLKVKPSQVETHEVRYPRKRYGGLAEWLMRRS